MLLIPELQLKKGLDNLIRLYYEDYKNANQALVIGYKDLTNGFDWQTTPQNLILNNKTVSINVNTNDIDTTVLELNKALKRANVVDCEFYYVNEYVWLHTISKQTTPQTIIISEGTGLLDTLGFDSGTYNGSQDRTDTYLYQLFGELKIDNTSYLNELVNLLTNTFEKKTANINQRLFKTRLDYNVSMDVKPPIAVITLANEELSELNELGRRDFHNESASFKFRNRKFEASYKIHLNSDNKNESVYLYHFIRSILEANVTYFGELGLQKLQTVSGGDLNVELEMPNMFVSVLFVKFLYEVNIPVIIDKSRPITKLFFKPTYFV